MDEEGALMERYWISGVQIGMLRVLINQDVLKAMEILQTIEDDQFITSNRPCQEAEKTEAQERTERPDYNPNWRHGL